VYVDDAVEATCRALEAPLSGELFNVGSGIAVGVEELIRQMTRVAGANVEPERGPPDWTRGSSRLGSPDKAAKLLAWRAETPLEEGLRRTLAWLDQRA
jgi:nucleoside-diphosphate-sugar epimerase